MVGLASELCGSVHGKLVQFNATLSFFEPLCCCCPCQHTYGPLKASLIAAVARKSTHLVLESTWFEVSIANGTETHRSGSDAQRLGHAQVLRERDAASLNVSHILLRVSRSSPLAQA